MTVTRAVTPALTALATTELTGHLADVCDELVRRSDHDGAHLVRALERLGRSMGELGQQLGTSRWTTAATGASGHSTYGVSRGVVGTLDAPPRPSMPEPASLPAPVVLQMSGINEARPGAAWRRLLEVTRSSYLRWYGSEGWAPRASLAECQAALERHMPELTPMWKHLVTLADADDDLARMLSLWNPPAFAPGCSQLATSGPQRALVRNYDYDPALFEGVSVSSHWTDRRVIGTSDCLWGLLDGMNDRGLAVSLTFGGIPGTGRGFAIPLVVRYLLEGCDTVDEARSVLAGLPVSASYNLTLTDRSGVAVTVFLAPGRAPECFDMPLATNHRGLVPDRPDLARRFRSVERQDVLLGLERDRRPAGVVAESFLSAALRSTDFEGGFGTLYTADYRPDSGEVFYRWPGATWRRAFSSADEELRVRLR